jgi:hypothetical protein
MKEIFIECPNCNTAFLAEPDYTKEPKPGKPKPFISHCTNCDEVFEVSRFTD